MAIYYLIWYLLISNRLFNKNTFSLSIDLYCIPFRSPNFRLIVPDRIASKCLILSNNLLLHYQNGYFFPTLVVAWPLSEVMFFTGDYHPFNPTNKLYLHILSKWQLKLYSLKTDSSSLASISLMPLQIVIKLLFCYHIFWKKHTPVIVSVSCVSLSSA